MIVKKIKLLQLATAYQSVVTILDSKLRVLEECQEIELFVASSFEDASEQRKPHGKFTRVDIPRSIKLIKDLRAAAKVYKLIKQENIDIVHTHTAKAGIVGAIAAFWAGVPVIHTYHGLPFYDGQNPLAHALYKLIEIFFSRIRKLIFSQNRRDYEALKKINSIKCPVQFEGNGVDIQSIESNAEKNKTQVEGLYKTRNPRILCISRLEPVKNISTVIKAIAALKNKGHDIECVIAGQGPMKDSLQAEIDNMELSGSIRIIYTPHIHALISSADIVVLASVKEGIPRGIMEAMALDKPVLATDVLGTNELVVHDQTGILVPLGDQDAFDNGLLTLIRDTDLQKRLGSAGRKRIIEHFDDRKIVDLWVEKYKEILK